MKISIKLIILRSTKYKSMKQKLKCVSSFNKSNAK